MVRILPNVAPNVYTNRDKRIVKVSRREKDYVERLRRRAERREARGEHVRRTAVRATRRGWWYAWRRSTVDRCL
jgi:hypothetical protein